MSDQINDGGPAFPNAPSDPGYTKWDEGISLRDWFAGQAMQALVGSMLTEKTRTKYNINKPEHLDCVALDSYAIADAMIKARGGAK